MIISAILSSENKIYTFKEEFSYVSYELSESVFFDEDIHPYRLAFYEDESFKDESFRFYDLIFLGYYGCYGENRYIDNIKEAINTLSALSEYGRITKQFNKFKKTATSKRADKIKAEFGIGAGTNVDEELEEYLGYDEDDEDKDNLIFWYWFRNKFIDEKEYKKKCKQMVVVGQKKAFDAYIAKKVSELESAGFQKVS